LFADVAAQSGACKNLLDALRTLTVGEMIEHLFACGAQGSRRRAHLCREDQRRNRKALGKAIAALQAGDVLLVTRLDRLARSTRDLLNVLDAIAKAGAGFRSLADIWADTTTPHGKLMITILGGLAEFERELIKSRCDDGRRRAMARGCGSAAR
jgi:hypothetical protein